MTLSTVVTPEQRADAARTRIFESTCGDPEWLAAARTHYNVAHCHVPANSEEKWAAVHALEEMATAAEQTYRSNSMSAAPDMAAADQGCSVTMDSYRSATRQPDLRLNGLARPK